MSNQISSTAATARENARCSSDGRFGQQEHSRADGVNLDGPVDIFEDRFTPEEIVENLEGELEAATRDLEALSRQNKAEKTLRTVAQDIARHVPEADSLQAVVDTNGDGQYVQTRLLRADGTEIDPGEDDRIGDIEYDLFDVNAHLDSGDLEHSSRTFGATHRQSRHELEDHGLAGSEFADHVPGRSNGPPCAACRVFSSRRCG